MEWAGAFGDLGTLIPFVVAYIAVLKIDPFGILFTFGAAMVVCGLYYKTPFPVQPMKAIGAVATTQAAQTAVITQAAVYSASLVTGLLWLALGLTGAATRIARLVPRPVVVGIVLGLGLGFMLEGIKMMSDGWAVAAIGLLGTLLLLANRAIPAMFLLLLYGGVCGAVQNPEFLHALYAVKFELHTPHLVLSGITGYDLMVGTVFLALPQIPLTLGNAVIAIREENNRLFPDRPVTEKTVATSTGLMNLTRRAVRRGAYVSWRRRHGGARCIRSAHRRRTHHPRRVAAVPRIFLQRLHRDDLQRVPARRARCNPFSDGRAAGPGFLRFQQGQGRAAHHAHDRGVCDVECRPGIRRGNHLDLHRQAGTAAAITLEAGPSFPRGRGRATDILGDPKLPMLVMKKPPPCR